jgi:mannose-6-phosphate isomerase-like protein (cupin superfamily)
MYEISQKLSRLNVTDGIKEETLIDEITEAIDAAGYEIVEQNNQKPWGAYIRINGNEANRFVEEFFPGLSASEARLGIENAELSPKLLIVAPGARLSWQYHNRRAERWVFLSGGGYYKSTIDAEGDMVVAQVGDIVQFAQGERHRLAARPDGYTIVAEIWQHTHSDNMSNEDDIIRLADDYSR